MSDVISTPTSTFVTQVIEVHEPIVSASQGPQGIAGARLLTEMNDIDFAGLADGGMLVYQQSLSKWKIATTLDKQVIDCGQY